MNFKLRAMITIFVLFIAERIYLCYKLLESKLSREKLNCNDFKIDNEITYEEHIVEIKNKL